MFIYIPDQETTTPPSGSTNWGDIGGDIEDQADLIELLDEKQAKLVSGTNIKTINGESLLGTENIVINGGGIEPGLLDVLYVDNSTVILFSSPFYHVLTTLTGLKLSSGTCTITIQINGVNVGGLSGINVTTTPQDLTTTSLNVVKPGQLVTLVISNSVNASRLQFNLSDSMSLFNVFRDWIPYCPQDITGFYTIDFNQNISYSTTNYCPQDITGFYTIDFNQNISYSTTNYCPQDTTNFYDFATAP
jgi:hypothetical protein